LTKYGVDNMSKSTEHTVDGNMSSGATRTNVVDTEQFAGVGPAGRFKRQNVIEPRSQ